MSRAVVDTPFGPIALDFEGETLIGVDLEPEPEPEPEPESEPESGTDPGPAAVPPGAAIRQLADYFADGRRPFDLTLAPCGTAFQRRVWAAMLAIPPGETRTYGEIARALGSAPRAVGQACRANPCPIVVPCHRVVGAEGLGGFAGDSSGRLLEVKRWLLRHEGARLPGLTAPERPAGTPEDRVAV